MTHLSTWFPALAGLLVPAILAVWTFIRRQAWRHSSSRFKQYVVYILDALFYSFGRLFARRMAIHVTLKRYATLQLARADTRYLHIPGGAPLEVDTIFVPLSLATDDEKFSDSSLLDFASRSGGRVRILGDPGSGKSSLTKKLFRSVCLSVTTKDRVKPTLPILLELKTLEPPPDLVRQPDLGDWLLEVLKSAVVQAEGFDTEGLFQAFLKDRGLTVFLDGLDEVATINYPKVVMAINGLSSRLGQKSSASVILLTMRTQFHSIIRADLESNYPTVLTIAPFTPGDIFEFLSRYPFREQQADKGSKIYADLTDRPTLREMCRNPLVLSMYAAHDQAQASGGVPDSRTTFYNQVTDELLVARRSRQMGTTARTTLREQREAILGHLALENLLNPAESANHISYKSFYNTVGRVYKIKDDSDIERRLNEIVRDTGIVNIEREGESLRFIHLTFCEFLAAKEAALGREQGWDVIRRTHVQLRSSGVGASRLVEVLPFALALLPRVRRPNALASLAALADPRVLARGLLETQLYGESVLDRYIQEELAALTEVTPENWDNEWRDRLHLFLVVLEDARSFGNAAGVIPSYEDVYQQLIAGAEDRMLRLFGSYAEHDPAAALRLAESFGVDLTQGAANLVLKNASNRPFLVMVLDKMLTPDRAVRWAILLACAGLSNTLAALQIMRTPEVPALRGLAKGRRRGWSYLSYVWRLNRPPRERNAWAMFSIRPKFVETAYTQCLHVASETSEVPVGIPLTVLERLQALRSVKRPNSFLFRGGEAVIGSMAIVTLLLFGFVQLRSFGVSPLIVFMTVWYAIVMSSLTYTQDRDRLYLKIVNLDPWRTTRLSSRFRRLSPPAVLLKTIHGAAYSCGETLPHSIDASSLETSEPASGHKDAGLTLRVRP